VSGISTIVEDAGMPKCDYLRAFSDRVPQWTRSIDSGKGRRQRLVVVGVT
jgi:hypothetical protein